MNNYALICLLSISIMCTTSIVDINECFEAALGSTNLCESDPNSQCVNSEGSFECVCVPGYILNENRTCERKHMHAYI